MQKEHSAGSPDRQILDHKTHRVLSRASFRSLNIKRDNDTPILGNKFVKIINNSCQLLFKLLVDSLLVLQQISREVAGHRM